MKKLYFLLFPLLLLTGYAAQSQCTNTFAFGTVAIPANNSIVQISTCSFAGDYSTINGAVSGQTLNFTFNNLGTGAYITIRSGTPGGPVVASGNSPLSFVNTFTGTLYAHWNLSAACGTDGSCHVTTVQCTSCPPINDGCAGAVTINCAQTITGTTVGATLDAVPTCVTTLNTAPGLWYTFVGNGQSTTLSLCGSAYDTKIGVFTGTCGALVCVTGNDDFCGLQSQVTFTATNAVTYYVLVTGFSTNAGAFTLARTCVSSIPNDDCATAITVACGSTTTGNTTGATIDAAPTCITALNTAPGIWYKFVGTGLNTTVSLCGSGYDTKIGVFSGTCAALVCVTGNDDFCGLQSQVSFTATLGTTYYILVTGFGTAAGAFTMAVTCAPAIPNDICTGAITIGCGQTITGTTVGATADPVAACNGVTLSGAPGIWYTFVGNGANNTLDMCGSGYDTEIGVFAGTCPALVCVTANDDFCGLQSQVTFATTLGTTYYVLVTGFGTASGTFTLTRTSAPLPNDVCTGAININCGQTITGSTACGATPDAVATCVTALNTANGLWYQFVGDGSPVTLSLCGSSFDTKIGVFRGTCAALVCVTGNDDFCGLQSQVTFTPNAGVTYYILVTGFSTATGNFTLTRTCAPPCTGVPSPGSITPATSTVCVGSSVTLTCSGYPPNTGLTFQWNSAPAAAGPYTAIAGATSNVYTFNAPAATTYYTCTVTCTSAGGGSSTTAPPVVVNVSNIQFTSAVATPSTVCSPGSVVITGTVTGGLNLGNYTYTLTGPGTIGPAVPSGTNNSSVSFTVTNIPAGNQVYTLTATDPVPCSKSTTINVTVNLTPVVTLAPASATICNGNIQPITGTVTTGTGTFVFSPLTELYTDAGAVTAYTGTALASGTTIYAKPTVTRTYTATVTSALGCSSSTPITITVNQLPAITVQPTPATQTICPGFNVTYTVGATGTGLTYQWRRNGVNLVNGGQINLSTISGATTNTLTITNLGAANAGNYDVVVSGTCPPPVTSNTVVLNVGSAPTITTQPSNVTVCANTNAVFTVVAGGVPPPTIYQWQVSTTGAGGPWTNLTTGGSFTPTFTITATPIALNGNFYRVIITNSCGQSITSNAVSLTVNAIPVVVATDLFNQRVCISDTLVPLVGSPVGGSWSGIGVSGFNFVPPATALGTYVLTYTYTNSFGCTISDTTTVKVSDCPERLRELTKDALIIYPNPNNGHFNVRMNSTLYNYLGMKVYNMSGQLMIGNAVTNSATNRETLVTPTYTGLVYGRVIPINLSQLASGTYLVEFYYDDGIRTSKKGYLIMIEK
jgi:Secretion system C-terminal sorting domain